MQRLVLVSVFAHQGCARVILRDLPTNRLGEGFVIRVVLGLGEGAGDGEERGVRGAGGGGTQRHGWLSKLYTNPG